MDSEMKPRMIAFSMFEEDEVRCDLDKSIDPVVRAKIVRGKILALDRLGRMYRRKNDPQAGSMQDIAIRLARSISDHELLAEMCWHMSFCWHRTIDEGESMDVALEGMHAAQLAGSELWTRICRAEALFDGLGGTYPRVSTPMDWAPEAQTLDTAIAAMRSHISYLEPLHPEASWITRAYLACLFLWDGQEEPARREWRRSLELSRQAGSRFAEAEILTLHRGGMWDEDPD